MVLLHLGSIQKSTGQTANSSLERLLTASERLNRPSAVEGGPGGFPWWKWIMEPVKHLELRLRFLLARWRVRQFFRLRLR